MTNITTLGRPPFAISISFLFSGPRIIQDLRKNNKIYLVRDTLFVISVSLCLSPFLPFISRSQHYRLITGEYSPLSPDIHQNYTKPVPDLSTLTKTIFFTSSLFPCTCNYSKNIYVRIKAFGTPVASLQSQVYCID